MKGVENLLRTLMEGRRRWWTVIIVTCVVLLVSVLPAVDEYIDLRDHATKSAESLRAATAQAGRLDFLRQRGAEVEASLHHWHSKSVTGEGGYRFRDQMVKLTRESSCQVRRIQMGNPSFRPWNGIDDPLTDKRAKKSETKRKTKEVPPYQLRLQSLSLSATGSLANTKQLLAMLKASGTMMQIHSLSIRPSGERRQTVVLDLQLMLLGLEEHSEKRNEA